MNTEHACLQKRASDALIIFRGGMKGKPKTKHYTTYKKGDIVLAKCVNYPRWPGFIMSHYNATIYKVSLYSSGSYAFIDVKDMQHLDLQTLDQIKNKSNLKNYKQAVNFAYKKLKDRERGDRKKKPTKPCINVESSDEEQEKHHPLGSPPNKRNKEKQIFQSDSEAAVGVKTPKKGSAKKEVETPASSDAQDSKKKSPLKKQTLPPKKGKPLPKILKKGVGAKVSKKTQISTPNTKNSQHRPKRQIKLREESSESEDSENQSKSDRESYSKSSELQVEEINSPQKCQTSKHLSSSILSKPKNQICGRGETLSYDQYAQQESKMESSEIRRRMSLGQMKIMSQTCYAKILVTNRHMNFCFTNRQDDYQANSLASPISKKTNKQVVQSMIEKRNPSIDLITQEGWKVHYNFLIKQCKQFSGGGLKEMYEHKCRYNQLFKETINMVKNNLQELTQFLLDTYFFSNQNLQLNLRALQALSPRKRFQLSPREKNQNRSGDYEKKNIYKMSLKIVKQVLESQAIEVPTLIAEGVIDRIINVLLLYLRADYSLLTQFQNDQVVCLARFLMGKVISYRGTLKSLAFNSRRLGHKEEGHILFITYQRLKDLIAALKMEPTLSDLVSQDSEFDDDIDA